LSVEIPDVQYVRRGDVAIAYQVMGRRGRPHPERMMTIESRPRSLKQRLRERSDGKRYKRWL
jgi:hypothetical protein